MCYDKEVAIVIQTHHTRSKQIFNTTYLHPILQAKNKENQWISINNPNGIDLFIDLNISQEQEHNSSANTELSNQHEMITRRKHRNDPLLAYHMVLTTENNMLVAEPKSYETAMKISCWLEAIEDEVKALKNNDTWSLVTIPKESTWLAQIGFSRQNFM